MARRLRASSQQHYGVASREYLAAVVPAIDEIRKTVQDVVRAFCDSYVPVCADGQVERVAQRFGLIAAGGEIAKLFDIVRWERGAAVEAASKCFEQWLSSRGGHEAAETRDGIEQVRAFFHADGMSRFIPAWEEVQSRAPIRDVAGYREQMGDGWGFLRHAICVEGGLCRVPIRAEPPPL